MARQHNLNNGSRLETYCVAGEPGSGTVCMNGAAARWSQVGDAVILLAYALVDEREARSVKPRIVFVDEQNRICEKAPV